MEYDQDTTPSNKHQKTKQKWKASAVAVRKNEKTKTRDKSLSTHTKHETFEKNREDMTNSHSQSLDSDYRSITRNLMQITLDEKGEQTQDIVHIVDESTPNEVLLRWNELEERNIDLAQKLVQYDELDYGAVDLSSLNVIDDDIPFIFARVFQRPKKKCTYLVLRDNALTSVGIKILVDELLKTPTSLRNLGLSSNSGIGDAGVEHLVRLLKGNRSITILALHNTGITDQGVRLLADVLADINGNSLSSLEKLYISFNKSITDESLEPLIQILEYNQTLKVFSLQHCSLSNKARRQLRQIGTKKKRKKLNLSE